MNTIQTISPPGIAAFESFRYELDALPTAPDPERPQHTPQSLGQTILDAMFGYETSIEYEVYSPTVRADLMAFDAEAFCEKGITEQALALALGAYQDGRAQIVKAKRHI